MTDSVEIRNGDTEVHPAAVEREEQAVADGRTRRLRFWGGATGVVLCSVAFLVALYRDQHLVLAGAFVGMMVAANIIPYTFVRDAIVLRFKGGGGVA